MVPFTIWSKGWTRQNTLIKDLQSTNSKLKEIAMRSHVEPDNGTEFKIHTPLMIWIFSTEFEAKEVMLAKACASVLVKTVLVQDEPQQCTTGRLLSDLLTSFSLSQCLKIQTEFWTSCILQKLMTQCAIQKRVIANILEFCCILGCSTSLNPFYQRWFIPCTELTNGRNDLILETSAFSCIFGNNCNF